MKQSYLFFPSYILGINELSRELHSAKEDKMKCKESRTKLLRKTNKALIQYNSLKKYVLLLLLYDDFSFKLYVNLIYVTQGICCTGRADGATRTNFETKVARYQLFTS